MRISASTAMTGALVGSLAFTYVTDKPQKGDDLPEDSSAIVGGGLSAGSGSSGGVDANGNIIPDGNTGPLAELPEGWYTQDGKIYDNEGNVQGNSLFSSNDPKVDVDGTPMAQHDPTGQNQTSLPGFRGDQTPGIALNTKQLAQIRETNPNFKLGDTLYVAYNGKTVPVKYFDNAGSGANNYSSHLELSPAALDKLGIGYKANGTGVNTPKGGITVLNKT
jgi:hypothetical protein